MIFGANYRDEAFDVPFVNLKVSKRLIALIAAGCTGLLGVLGILGCFMSLVRVGMYAAFFKTFLFHVCSIGFAVMIVLDKKYIMFPAAQALMLIFSGLSALIRLFSGYGFANWLHNYFAVALVDLLLLALMAVTMFDKLASYRSYAQKFWFIPGAVLIVTNVIYFFSTVRFFRYYWNSYLFNLIELVGVLAFSLWIANTAYAPLYVNGKEILQVIAEKLSGIGKGKPAGEQTYTALANEPQYGGAQNFAQGEYNGQPYGEQNQYGAAGYQPPQGKPDGHIDMLVHILLLFLTCGIWTLIWIYKTTAHLNGHCRSMAQRNTVAELLLCMFVPFYQIHWTYQTGKRVDAMARENGVQSDLATICLILEIFIPCVPVILLQSKINEVAAR